MTKNCFDKNFKIPMLITVIFILAGIFYLSYATPIYQSVSISTIQRPTIENPDHPLPELRNRWVWLRDGLSIKGILSSDYFILNVIKAVKELDIKYKFPQELSLFDKKNIQDFNSLKKNINIDYSGPDDNFYTLKIKSHSPKLSHQLNLTFIKKFMKYIATKNEQIFLKVIKNLNSKISTSKNTNEKAYLLDILNKIKFTSLTSKISSEYSFKLLQSPHTNITKIWPMTSFILIASLVLGISFGYAFNLIVSLITHRKSAPEVNK